MNVLSSEFSLHPWSALEERISCLQSKYLDLLQLRDQEKYFYETSVLATESYSQEASSAEDILILYRDESDEDILISKRLQLKLR